MNRSLIATIAITSLLIGTLGNSDFASAQKPRSSKTNDPKPKVITPRAIGGADAPFARLAAYVKVEVNRSVTVFRTKGVAAVTSPSVGLVCIQPSPSFDVKRAIPVASVDFSSSSFSTFEHNIVEYRSSGIGCPSGNLAFKTFVLANNQLRSDDGVAFTVIVP